MIGTLTLMLALLLIALLVQREFLVGLTRPLARRLRMIGRMLIPPLSLLVGLGLLAQMGTTVSTAGEEAGSPTAAPLPPTATAQQRPLPATATVEQEERRVGRVMIDERFDEPSVGWLAREAETWSASFAEGRYNLVLNGQTSIGVSRALPPGDYRIALEVRAAAGGAGVVFLSAEPATFYRLLITADGAYSVQVVEEDTQLVTPLIDWTASDAVLQGAAGNLLGVERYRGVVSVAINDVAVASFAVPEGRIHNQVGVALASRQGQGSASFDNLRVEQLEAEPRHE